MFERFNKLKRPDGSSYVLRIIILLDGNIFAVDSDGCMVDSFTGKITKLKKIIDIYKKGAAACKQEFGKRIDKEDRIFIFTTLDSSSYVSCNITQIKKFARFLDKDIEFKLE